MGGWRHVKIYTKCSVSNKILRSLYKGLTSKWFYEDNIIILGHIVFWLLFAWTSKAKLLKSWFFILLESIWIGPKICGQLEN